MNADKELREQLIPLLDALIDGKISADDHARLEALLDEQAEARELYSQYLEHDFGISQLQLSESQPNAVEELMHQTTQRTSESRLRLILTGALVATAACLVVGLLFYTLWTPASPSPGELPGPIVDHPPAADSTIAKVMRLIDVEWSDSKDTLALGDSLDAQWIRLESGILQLELSSGAVLSLEGPAALRIDSETECFVQHGKVVVLGPPDLAEFTVTSPGSRVVDLGTEFAVVVGATGNTDVHVLDGEVEVSLVDNRDKPLKNKRLLESEAASLLPSDQQIRTLQFDSQPFEPMRSNNLARSQPLRLQFDCGMHAGAYEGVQSPAHADGVFYQHEKYWNPIVGDQKGRFLAADGTLVPFEIEIDFGQRVKHQKTVSWDEPPITRGSSGKSHGVFDTALGQDGVRGGNTIGMRIRGLPKGTYKIYLMGRSALVHPKWGNALTDKAYVNSIGASESAPTQIPIDPLDDPDASKWVQGQTHAVTKLVVDGPDEYVILIVSKDRAGSPVPVGGGAKILGVQIVQLGAK